MYWLWIGVGLVTYWRIGNGLEKFSHGSALAWFIGKCYADDEFILR